jgi:hypothetical protein
MSDAVARLACALGQISGYAGQINEAFIDRLKLLWVTESRRQTHHLFTHADTKLEVY